MESCHGHGMRFFIDVVMAFGKNEAYEWIDHDHFHIDVDGRNPSWSSDSDHPRSARAGAKI